MRGLTLSGLAFSAPWQFLLSATSSSRSRIHRCQSSLLVPFLERHRTYASSPRGVTRGIYVRSRRMGSCASSATARSSAPRWMRATCCSALFFGQEVEEWPCFCLSLGWVQTEPSRCEQSSSAGLVLMWAFEGSFGPQKMLGKFACRLRPQLG